MKVFTVVLVVLLAVGVGVNVAAMCGRRFIDPATAMMLYRNVDDRLAKKAAIMLRPRPRVVVFGSSRALGITSRATGVTSDQFLNAAVGGAAVEDYAALWRVLEQHGKVPEIALFSIDPWVFSRTQPPPRWRSLAPEVAASLGQSVEGAPVPTVAEEIRYRWDAFTELFSFNVLRASARDLRRLWRARARSAEAAAAMADEDYGRHWPALSPAELRRRAIEYGREGGGVPDPHWDERRAAWLKRLWAAMRARGVRIVAYVPPYHPDALAAVREDPAHRAFLEAVDRFLVGVAGTLGVTFVDVADPATIPCAADEFWDGHHAKTACLDRLTSRLLHT